MQHNEIRSIPCTICKVCGSTGRPIYKGLEDRIFNSQGSWNFDQCQSKECGLMWLNPMPLEQDIHIAYKSYYTHREESQNKSSMGRLISIGQRNLLKLLLRLTPIYMERQDFNQMYLKGIKPGRLLCVGCGNGLRVVPFVHLGWSVEGQEIDPISAAIASKNGIRVHIGPLDELNLPEASYEAIVMNHVIEHVHDPTKLLMECRRLLMPNGILIAITPNINSYGHRLFKSNWRGLEPPRHIILFCQKSLHLLAKNAGFENPITRTTAANAHHFALDSLNICNNCTNLNPFKKAFYNMSSKLFLIVERIVQSIDKDAGEECILKLRKSPKT